MRLIEANFPASRIADVRAAIVEEEPDHFAITENGECAVARIFFGDNGAQELVDRLQSLGENDKDWRIIVIPVEATSPKIDDEARSGKQKKRRETALREEIYEDVAKGADLTTDFLVLTVASTIVAAVGLNENNVAAVIGAMVIAPLLGPILAITFGATLGDFSLIIRAGRNAAIGLGTGLASAVAIGLFLPLDLTSNELMTRTVVGLDSIALALAAGAAAALSIVAGAPSALVGVMVAVALLPPAAAAGLFLGHGDFNYALRAALLLVVNVVCIMFSSQAVYYWKGVRPRTWLEKRSAKNAMRVNFIVLGLLLASAAAIVLLTPADVMPDNPVKEESK